MNDWRLLTTIRKEMKGWRSSMSLRLPLCPAGENWNTVMYDGIRATGWCGAREFDSTSKKNSFSSFFLFLSFHCSFFLEKSENWWTNGCCSLKESPLRLSTLFFLFALDSEPETPDRSADSRALVTTHVLLGRPASQVVLFGNFVILNLFLAILMSNFDEQRGKLHEALESKRELTRVGCSAGEAPVKWSGVIKHPSSNSLEISWTHWH